ncbi:MAG: ribosome small subunit-dependent GTPase A [Syntrophotaleaceae bacterium]
MSRRPSKSASRQKSSVSSQSAGRQGVIVAHLGVAVEVLFVDGDRRQVRVKRRSGHVVGDAVLVVGEVLERLPRSTELRRRDGRGAVHLVGANLDVLGVVVAPRPAPPSGFVDRAVVAARAAGLEPFLIVNKDDLAGADGLTAELRALYGAALPVFSLSAKAGSGLDLLRRFMAEGHRGAFVGTTGVGKSSLLNALCPDLALAVGEICETRGVGRHTTTVATLHALPGGGELIDTPGFRDFGLVDIAVEELIVHFPGFEQAMMARCRFRGCRHRAEPGCAVTALVEKGL